MAFCIFIFIKLLNSIKDRLEKNKKEEVKVTKSNEEKLLEEIRDLLKKDIDE